ncbi:hypothetical protein P59_081 [Bacillus phage P59]|nr:hypothetical protein P59_081 [Bacillus phage P59]
MLPSIDTYLYDQIEEKLGIILSNRYIIEEILKGIQPSIATNFIRAYTGDEGREIPIVYTMPQDKESQRGAIYIGLREGQESATSLGNLEGTYEFKEEGFRKEYDVEVMPEEGNERCFLEVELPIGHLNNVEGIQFSRSDNVEVEGKRIYFKFDPELLGLKFTVNYVAQSIEEEEVGLKKGFTSTEHYSILVVSTNMDTVRCLDLIVKAILILMRSNKEENTNFLLQKLQFGQIEEINVGTDETPEILYGRESIVTYTASYSLDAPLLDTVLEQIKLKINYE